MAKLQHTALWLKNLPNKLTIARILCIPLLLLIYPISSKLHVFCAIVFALAALTDWLDGYLARRYGNVTPLGALLDPIADKMLIASSLVLLSYGGVLPPILAGLIIARDIGINGIRLMALEQGQKILVSDFGKLKTAVIAVATFCLIINQPLFNLPMREIGMVGMWVGLGLSLYSGWNYGHEFLRLNKNRDI